MCNKLIDYHDGVDSHSSTCCTSTVDPLAAEELAGRCIITHDHVTILLIGSSATLQSMRQFHYRCGFFTNQ